MSDHADELEFALDVPFLFRDRPASAPSDLRPVWRVPVVIILISRCRGAQATHEQLHVLGWAVRSADSAESLAAFLGGEIPAERAVVRLDPALDRAAALARGLGLTDWEQRYWMLTSAGRELLAEIMGDDELLVREKSLLAMLPKPLSQVAVSKLVRRERQADAA